MFDEAFLRNLGLIVIAAAFFASFGRATRLPYLLLYLFAGLTLGPLTGLIELSDTLHNISELGIILLLFLVGLELSFDKLRDLGKTILILGIGQIAFTTAGGFLLGLLFGFNTVHALFLGLGLCFSSTVVVVKMLEDKRQLDRLHGRVSVGILLIQDMAVIICLTVMAGVNPDGMAGMGFLFKAVVKSMVGMGLLLLGVTLVSRFVLPKPFSWAARSSETLFIWSLCWCFIVVLTAEIFHFSLEIGAFCAGISLAQYPFHADLQRRVNPLLQFFMGVFFVSLGAQMDPGKVSGNWGMVIACSLFTLLIKPMIIMVLASFSGMGRRASFVSGIYLSQISEFSLIFMSMGAQKGLVEPEMLASVGVIALTTIAASSFLISRIESITDYLDQRGWLNWLGSHQSKMKDSPPPELSGHVIVVGMNSLGRQIVERLHSKGEQVVVVDTNLDNVRGLSCQLILGNINSPSTLDQAGFPQAKLVVSAMFAEESNDLLAYRCQLLRIPCSIHVVDLEEVDNLLKVETTYLMIPKVDGIKAQRGILDQRGFFES